MPKKDLVGVMVPAKAVTPPAATKKAKIQEASGHCILKVRRCAKV